MKKLIIIIALIMGSISSFAQIKSASLTASGLTCSMCSKAIYKSLLKVPFIKDVTVDIEHSRYNINFRTGVPVIIDDLKKAVTDAGFAVASLKVTASFDNTEIENNAHIVYLGNTYHFLNVTKQKLSGDKTFTVVDKNFVSAAEYRKYKKYTSMKCFETGLLESCCASNNKKGSRVYHVTL